MSDNSSDAPALSAAIGHGLTTWAMVEFQLHALLHYSGQCSHGAVDAIWNDIKSFDAKMSVLRSIARVAFGETLLWRDYLLLHDETMRQAGLRNKLAHGTMVMHEGELKLRPFVAMGADSRDLSLDEVKAADGHFVELHLALDWLREQLMRHLKPEATQSLPATPEPGLILRLRKEDNQKKEAQRQRQLDLALVERLRQARKWPPPE